MASVNPMSDAAYAEQGARERTSPRWVVVLLWIVVMLPLVWGVMMTLKDVRSF